MRDMITNKLPAYPALNCNIVDIKDCSKAHLRAMERPEAANKRFIVSTEDTILLIRLADTLQEALDKNGYDYTLRRRSINNFVLRILGLFSRSAAELVPKV